MEKADFDYDYDQFRGELNTVTYAYKRIKDKLMQNFEHWKELGPKFLSDQLSVEVGEDGESVAGLVVGKHFSISLTPLAIENDNYALAVLTTVNSVSKLPVEIDRFLVSINGDVLSMEREVLLDWDNEYQSLKLLVAVARRVIRADSASVQSRLPAP